MSNSFWCFRIVLNKYYESWVNLVKVSAYTLLEMISGNAENIFFWISMFSLHICIGNYKYVSYGTMRIKFWDFNNSDWFWIIKIFVSINWHKHLLKIDFLKTFPQWRKGNSLDLYLLDQPSGLQSQHNRFN